MSFIAMISVEGVLAQGEDLKTAAPQKWARPLYDGIRSQFRTIALTRATEDIARWWLIREGFGHWSAVLPWNQLMSFEDWKVDQVREFLANGWDMSFYLDSDVDTCQRVQALGVLTLSVGTPVHPPGWRADDMSFQAWTDVVDTLDSRL